MLTVERKLMPGQGCTLYGAHFIQTFGGEVMMYSVKRVLR